jgi:DMSO/TMAO reductase YedYZ molybdopterin-dependent catalytic subunit
VRERDRLPPGQHEVDHLPTLHVGPVPRSDRATWDLRIEGEVRNAKRLSYEEVRALPSVICVSDFHCVESWSKLGLAWEGVRFSDLCDLVSPTTRARFVTIGCESDYTTSLPLEDMLRPDVILAWGLDGKELSPEKGFPLRLVVPHKYAYKSAKWVRWIRFTYEQELGYWEQRGYSDSADPWTEERRGGGL